MQSLTSSPYPSTDGGDDSCVPVHLLGAGIVTSPDEEEEDTEDDQEEDGDDQRHDHADRHRVVTAPRPASATICSKVGDQNYVQQKHGTTNMLNITKS